jgi:SAM-dependent methyltransferase
VATHPDSLIARTRAYYRAILPFYQRASATRGDLDFWAGLCAMWQPAHILEAGCGTGRVTAALTARHCVVGLDLSLDLLALAQRALGPPGRRIWLLAGDMRAFWLRKTFDLIVAANDPFAHLTRQTDRLAALCRLAAHLAPQGRLVIEGLTVPRPRVPHRRTAYTQTAEGTLLQIDEDWSPQYTPAHWRVAYHYTEAGGASAQAVFRARAWLPDRIASDLAAAGLRLETLWGDFDRRPFGPASERVIIVATLNPHGARTPRRPDEKARL